MCEPISIIAGATAAISIGSSIAGHAAAGKAAKANEAAARRAFAENIRSTNLVSQEYQEQTSQNIFQATRQARATRALASISAGESGIAGASAEHVLRDIDKDLASYRVAAERQNVRVQRQLERDKVAGVSTMRQRIAQVPPPNPFMLGMNIAGGLAQGASTYTGLRPNMSTAPNAPTISAPPTIPAPLPPSV
jgi:hypothetical protein